MRLSLLIFIFAISVFAQITKITNTTTTNTTSLPRVLPPVNNTQQNVYVAPRIQSYPRTTNRVVVTTTPTSTPSF
jgi:hypothetical protein